jgi:hypothetical protein
MSNRPYPTQVNGEWRKDVVITGSKVNKLQNAIEMNKDFEHNVIDWALCPSMH